MFHCCCRLSLNPVVMTVVVVVVFVWSKLILTVFSYFVTYLQLSVLISNSRPFLFPLSHSHKASFSQRVIQVCLLPPFPHLHSFYYPHTHTPLLLQTTFLFPFFPSFSRSFFFSILTDDLTVPPPISQPVSQPVQPMSSLNGRPANKSGKAVFVQR